MANAIQNAVTNVAVDITVQASDPRVRIINHTGVRAGIGSGQTATFDIEFVGDGIPSRFDLQFVRAGTNVVLGSIPVVLGTPIPGNGYEFEDLAEGEITSNVDFGSRLATNSAPTALALSNASVPENLPSGTVVGTLSATDPDAGETFTYSLVGGTGSTDNASFSVVGDKLSPTASFNFEAKSSYSVRLRVTDQGGLTFDQPFTITVTNVEESPTSLALSNTSVWRISRQGPWSARCRRLTPTRVRSSLTASSPATGATDNASFSVVGDQLLTAASFNFEAKSSYSVRLRVTDQGGLTFDRTFTITVVNVNEITGFNVQGHATQRSFIRYIDLLFEDNNGLGSLIKGDASA